MQTPLPRQLRLCFRPLTPRSAWLPPLCRAAGIGCPVLLGLLLAGGFAVTLPVAQAQNTATLKTLDSFSGTDGSSPKEPLVPGSDGSYYGTTTAGGASGLGTVFKITPAGVLTTLYSFSDGTEGIPSPLVQGTDGNFYGTTTGDFATTGSSGYGTVFQITPAGAFATLYTFSGTDGDAPTDGLVQGTDGNLYGTTTIPADDGNTNPGNGTVFEPALTGGLTTLYNFSGDDGKTPAGALERFTDRDID